MPLNPKQRTWSLKKIKMLIGTQLWEYISRYNIISRSVEQETKYKCYEEVILGIQSVGN